MNKKGQGEIITTILIILLVLAAIVIVWQVVNKTVTTGGEEVTAQSTCIGTSIKILSADVNGREIKITRNAGGYTGAVTYKVLVSGTAVTPTSTTLESLAQLESATIVVPALLITDYVEIAPVVGDQACTPNNKFDNIIDST